MRFKKPEIGIFKQKGTDLYYKGFGIEWRFNDEITVLSIIQHKIIFHLYNIRIIIIYIKKIKK